MKPVFSSIVCGCLVQVGFGSCQRPTPFSADKVKRVPMAVTDYSILIQYWAASTGMLWPRQLVLFIQHLSIFNLHWLLSHSLIDAWSGPSQRRHESTLFKGKPRRCMLAEGLKDDPGAVKVFSPSSQLNLFSDLSLDDPEPLFLSAQMGDRQRALTVGQG